MVKLRRTTPGRLAAKPSTPISIVFLLLIVFVAQVSLLAKPNAKAF
jgi:hypothetical protein